MGSRRVSDYSFLCLARLGFSRIRNGKLRRGSGRLRGVFFYRRRRPVTHGDGGEVAAVGNARRQCLGERGGGDLSVASWPPPIPRRAATVEWRAQRRWGPAGANGRTGARGRGGRAAGGVQAGSPWRRAAGRRPWRGVGARSSRAAPRRGGGGARRPSNPIFSVPPSLAGVCAP